MVDRHSLQFCIEVDFAKSVGDPSRIFQAMSDLIDALQDIDRSLIKTIDATIEPILLLEDVESGSIKAWLRQTINSLDDDALKKLDWKELVGTYLVKGKYLIINFLDKKTEITNTNQIAELEQKLLNAAEETGVNQIPVYKPVSRAALVQNIEKINNALSPLHKEDSASFLSSEGDTAFNLTLYISPDEVLDLITSEIIESKATMIMKVKKPDFLGESKWEFRYEGKIIDAKLYDTEWVIEYQSGKIPIIPGDAIKADVMVRVRYGYEGDVISTQYDILKVIDVIQHNQSNQKGLFE